MWLVICIEDAWGTTPQGKRFTETYVSVLNERESLLSNAAAAVFSSRVAAEKAAEALRESISECEQEGYYYAPCSGTKLIDWRIKVVEI